MIKEHLAQVRELIQGELDSENVEPWAARRNQHLIALLDRMLASQIRTTGRECAAHRYGTNVVAISSARLRRAHRLLHTA